MSDNEEPQPQGHVVKCGHCGGNGRHPRYPLTKKCDTCNGVGHVLLK